MEIKVLNMSLRGITESLQVLNQPIAELARLSQQQIIAMSQLPADSPNHIPPSYVSTIINAKADIAKNAAQYAAMQQPMKPSVIEQDMAINAQAEAPQMMAPQMAPMDSGVATLPVPDSMYGNEYAGGGIVAFDNGGLTGTFDMFLPETQYESVGSDLSRDFKDTDVGVDLPTIARSVAPAVRPAAAPAPKAETKESMLDRRRRLLEQLGVTDTTEEELAELDKNKGKLGDKRADAVKMALIRAGLSIAAGTSSDAITNIAKGGIEGFESYEQAINRIEKEEKEYGKLARDLRKEANAVKRSDVDKALALEHQAELLDIEKEKLKYTRLAANKTPAEIQLIERYAKDKGLTFSQAMREISGLKAEPKSRDAARKSWSENLYLQKQYPDFEDYYRFTSGSGGGGGGFRVLGKEAG
jgi:hypothetical protein